VVSEASAEVAEAAAATEAEVVFPAVAAGDDRCLLFKRISAVGI
jgi:hypothetical protein